MLCLQGPGNRFLNPALLLATYRPTIEKKNQEPIAQGVDKGSTVVSFPLKKQNRLYQIRINPFARQLKGLFIDIYSMDSSLAF